MERRDVIFILFMTLVGSFVYWLGFFSGFYQGATQRLTNARRIDCENGWETVEILRAAGPPPAFGKPTHIE